ncbi:MAG: nucleotidyltransferase domain-containing protein [Deltaproteobacteria bacterium]|nr:nucleotidyltransferase domain-containing protein [Deltaproteobacteria bacterium]
MVDPSIVGVVENYLAAVRRAGIHAQRGVVFGSRARGEARSDSDIDLVVIAPEFDGPRDRSRTALLWRLRAVTDDRIEPFGVGEKQWLEDDASPIIAVARRDGQEISCPK